MRLCRLGSLHPYSGGSNYTAGVYRFAGGSLFALRAEGINGGSFTGWSGLPSGNPNEPTQIITVTQNLTLTANFTGAVLPTTYTVSVTNEPLDGGYVLREGQPVSSPFSVPERSSLVLNAVPLSGYQFQQWQINGNPSGTTTMLNLTVGGDLTVVARWQPVMSSPDAPAAPSHFRATALSSSAIRLAWQDNSTNETGFELEWFINGGWEEMTAVGANQTTLDWNNNGNGLQPNTSYLFRIRAYRGNDVSAWTHTSATTLPPSIAPPVITAPDIVTTIYAPVTNYLIGIQNADSYSVTGLPSWLGQSGVSLSGTPTVAHIGNSSFTVTASNAGGTTSKTVSVQVLWPALDADLVLTQGDYVSQVVYPSSTLQANQLYVQPKHGRLPSGLGLTVRGQNRITIEDETVGDIELVGMPTQTGVFYADYELTVVYYGPYRTDVLPLRLRIQVVPSGGGPLTSLNAPSAGDVPLSVMSGSSTSSSYIPDTLVLSAYQPNATARNRIRLTPGFDTRDANSNSRVFEAAIVGGTNGVSGDSIVLTTRSDYELGASGNLLATYDDGALQASRYETGYGFIDNLGARFYYHRDHLGNVRAVSNASGNSVRWTDYFAYGAIRDEWSVQTGRDHYGFIGKELDRENSLNYFGARYFDAMTGVWNSVDPLWAKFPQYSPYIYGINNALRVIDDDGRDIIVLNASKGAGGFGHAAVLIGNDEKGWRLYSKNGTEFGLGASGPSTGSDIGVEFKTLEDFANQNFVKNSIDILYDGGFYLESDDETDALMEKAASSVAGSWYDVTAVTGLLGLGNCADVVTAALIAGKFKDGMTLIPKIEDLGIPLFGLNPGPNVQYEEIKKRNASMGKDVTHRITPSQKKQEERKKEIEQMRKEIEQIIKRNLENTREMERKIGRQP